MTVSDTEFVTQLRQGNEAAFETVFRSYYERLCNYANSMLNDIDEAEEMVQSTFLNIWEKRESIEIHTSVKSYLYQAVHNGCLNKIKHYKVKRAHSEAYKQENTSEYEHASNELISKELEQQINNAIESLPTQCRTVFKLSRFENLTYAEIAQQLNLSVKTIDNHMVKALRTMREKLKDYLPTLFLFILMKF